MFTTDPSWHDKRFIDCLSSHLLLTAAAAAAGARAGASELLSQLLYTRHRVQDVSFLLHVAGRGQRSS